MGTRVGSNSKLRALLCTKSMNEDLKEARKSTSRHLDKTIPGREHGEGPRPRNS